MVRMSGQAKALVLVATLLGATLPVAARAQAVPQTDARVLVTDRMLTAFKRMAEAGAPVLGEPAPGPDFIDNLRRYFATHPQTPQVVAFLSRAEELYPYVARGLAGMSPQHRAMWVHDRRAFLDTSPNKPFTLVTDMVGFATMTYNAAHGPNSAQSSALAQRQVAMNSVLGQQMFMNNFMQGQMQNYARSMGNLRDSTWSTRYSGSTR